MRVVFVLIAALAVLASPAYAGVVPGQSLDGPSPDILSLGGVALAQDATGGVVYLKRDAGVAHVFASLLAQGSWGAPLRIDGGIATPASQPVIAAAAGGRVAIAWISGGSAFGSVRAAGTGSFAGPQPIAAAIANTSLAMGISGTAYLTFTAADGTGSDVRAARLDRGSTGFVALPGALNSSPASHAGSGPAKRSRVIVAADATGVVVWGEDGADGRSHVLARRVFGLDASSVTLDATIDQLGGHGGNGADSPVVGIQDDSSYAWVAFRQSFDGNTVSRVVVRELIGSEFEAPRSVDSLAFPVADGADAPSLAINGTGDGLVASELFGTHQAIGAASVDTGFTPGAPVNQVTDSAAPQPVATLARNNSGLIAWQPDPGSIIARLFDQGTPAEQVALSRPELGPLDAGDGLSAATDDHGDVIVGYLQGDAASRRVAVADVVNPPESFSGLTTEQFVRFPRPRLQWEPAKDTWSPVVYRVLVDGKQLGSTTATTFTVPTAISDGLHHWQVIALDSLGQQTPAALRRLRIASRPPRVRIAVRGARRAGGALRVSVRVLSPAPLARVRLRYGDGATSTAKSSRHRYAHAGRFVLRASVVDVAGNRASARAVVQIK